MGRASRNKRERRGHEKLTMHLPAPLRDKCEIQINTTHPKISDALEYLIAPYLDSADSLQRMQNLVALAVLAWNLTLFDDEGLTEERQRLHTMMGTHDDADIEVLLAVFEMRKRERYADDKRMIVSFDVSDRGKGGYFVQAATTLMRSQ